MRKLVFALLLVIYSCSSSYKTINIYHKDYPKHDIQFAKTDIFYQIKEYGGDSIDLDNWITNKSYFKFKETTEKVYVKKIDEKTFYVYRFIINKDVNETIIHVVVNCNTKNKKLYKQYYKKLK